MLLTWTPQAWEDYLYWQHTDKRTVKRINELLRDAMRNPFEGLGKPEPLRFDLAGCWSRRINQEDHLVYKAGAATCTANDFQFFGSIKHLCINTTKWTNEAKP